MGQVFIFVTIAKFGALMCSLIGLGRKIVTLIVSIIIYQHPVDTQQGIGLSMAEGGDGLQLRRSRREARSKKADGGRARRRGGRRRRVAGLLSGRDAGRRTVGGRARDGDNDELTLNVASFPAIGRRGSPMRRRRE